MNVILFGLGSIGQRHARLLLKHFNHSVYAFRSGKGSKRPIRGVQELSSWSEVRSLNADAAFITNPTHLHIDTAVKCARLGMHLFIEKPIDCSMKGLKPLLKIIEVQKLSSYVAYCLRFHPAIEEMKKLLSNERNVHLRAVSSSYLPDWRPERDYKDVYSAKAAQGGGVLLDLSHEIDYTAFLLGNISAINGHCGHISNLKTDCEDYADLLLRCRRGSANIHLNVFSRKQQRSVTATLSDGRYIKVDLIKNILVRFDGKKIVKKQYKVNRDDIFIKQLKYFFANIKNKRMMNNLPEASQLFSDIITFRKKYAA